MQVKAVLCAALYPNVAVMDDSAGKTTRPAWNDGNAAVFIHPSSINHALDAHQFLRPYLMYLEKVGDCALTCCMTGDPPGPPSSAFNTVSGSVSLLCQEICVPRTMEMPTF